MNGKGMRTLVIAGLLIAAMVAVAMPVQAEYTTHYSINTGQEIAFFLHGADDETVEVAYYPHEIGNRKFEAWHETLFYWDKVATMSFYWTDNYGQTWHKWRNAPVGYYWPKTTENLYSGSTNIGYKFAFKSYVADGLVVHVKIT